MSQRSSVLASSGTYGSAVLPVRNSCRVLWARNRVAKSVQSVSHAARYGSRRKPVLAHSSAFQRITVHPNSVPTFQC